MILLALPTYNEEAGLGALLEDVVQAAPRIPNIQVLVVDDGCSDRSVAIAESFKSRLDLVVVHHARNSGLGAAIRTCLEEFERRAVEDSILVTMDADNTHPPALIPSMLEKIRQGTDVVVASRFVPGAQVTGVPGARRFLSDGLRFYAKAVFPIRGINDYSSGYRAYRGGYLLPILRRVGTKNLVHEDGFAAMPELLMRLYLADRRMRAAEVPIDLRYDLKRSASKMRVLRNVAKVSGLTLRLGLRRWLPG